MSVKVLVCARFQDHSCRIPENGRGIRGWGMQKRKPSHFCTKSFTERYIFCFKTPNNFRFSKSAKKDQKLHSWAAFSPSDFSGAKTGFSQTIGKTPSIFTKKSDAQSRPLKSIRYLHKTIFYQNDQNASRREIPLRDGLWNSRNRRDLYRLAHFALHEVLLE